MSGHNFCSFKNNKRKSEANTASQEIKRKGGFCKLLQPAWGTISMTLSLEVKSLGWCPGGLCRPPRSKRPSARTRVPVPQTRIRTWAPGAMPALLGQTWLTPKRMPSRVTQQGNKVIMVSTFTSKMGVVILRSSEFSGGNVACGAGQPWVWIPALTTTSHVPSGWSLPLSEFVYSSV